MHPKPSGNEPGDDDINWAFVDGVELHSEFDDDSRRATALAIASINDEPWERWW